MLSEARIGCRDEERLAVVIALGLRCLFVRLECRNAEQREAGL